MTQRTNHPQNKTLLIVATCALSLLISNAHADIIAFTSFEEPDVFSSRSYTDTLDADSNHDLLNNDNQPIVNWTQTAPGAELGFFSYYSNTRNGEGLTDGDSVGVTSSTSEVSLYTEGVKGFQMNDTDGLMTTTLDPVNLNGFVNPQVSMDLFVSETGWELNDRIRVWVSDGSNETDLFNSTGLDIDDMPFTEGSWITLSANLTGFSTATLAFELDSNSASENIYVDNISFTGNIAPVPVPGTCLLASLGMGVASVWLRRKKH